MIAQTYRRRRDVMFTTVDGEVLVLDVEQGQCFGMNAVASEVWVLLEHPRTLDEICGKLIEQFEIESNQCREEIGTLLEQFRGDGLVEVQPAR